MTVANLIFSALAGPNLILLGKNRSYENPSDLLSRLKAGIWLIKYYGQYERATIYSRVKIIQGGSLLQEALELKKLGIKGK